MILSFLMSNDSFDTTMGLLLVLIYWDYHFVRPFPPITQIFFSILQFYFLIVQFTEISIKASFDTSP